MSQRLLWLSQLVPYPPHAGVLLRAYHLLRAVAQEFDVDLVAFVQQSWLKTCFGDVDTGLTESRKALGEFCKRIDFVDIPAEVSPLGRYGLAARSLFGCDGYTMLWLSSSAARQLLQMRTRETQYAHVHYDTISLSEYRPLFPASTATLGHHNIESHMMLRRAKLEKNIVKRAFYAQEATKLLRAERRAASTFDAHITCSELDNERLLAGAGAVTAIAVPNGVDTEYFRPGCCETVANTLVFVGTMDWYPNAAAMTFFTEEVWPLISATYPDATLGIVGSKPAQVLRELAQRDARVRVYGYVPDVRPYLAGTKLFVCPIRDGGGTKLKILDAMAMGCAIVAHPIACEGINVQDGVDVTFASTAQDFLQVIGTLLKDDEKRQRLGVAARELAIDEYSFAAIGQDFAKSLHNIIDHPAPRF